MLNKTSSILDYQQDALCGDIWLDHGQMRPAIKTFILSMMTQFFEDLNIMGSDAFVAEYYVGSSLATYFYKADSDLDVKAIIDMSVFKDNNPGYAHIDDDEVLESLIKLGRKSLWATAFIPATNHPLDTYFYSTEEASAMNLLKYDSLYSITKDMWLKEPKRLPKGLSTEYVLQQAKEKADNFIIKLDEDILNTKRDSIDFALLIDYIKTLSYDEVKEFAKQLRKMYETIDFDLAQLVKDRDIIKKMRQEAFSGTDLKSELAQLMQSFNYSDGNIVFKLLQRYGYMRILTEIHDLYTRRGLTTDNVKDFIDILSRN